MRAAAALHAGGGGGAGGRQLVRASRPTGPCERPPPLPAASHCRAPAQTAVLVKRLRQALDALLRRKAEQPRVALEDGGGGALMRCIVDLLVHEEASQRWDR